MSDCLIAQCQTPVTKEGHYLCYAHWQALKSGQVKKCGNCDAYFESVEGSCSHCVADTAIDSTETLSSTKLGKQLGLSAQKLNLVLAELGWIEKFTKGWKPTTRGKQLGAIPKEARSSGVPYVTWPDSILDHKVLRSTVGESLGEGASSRSAAPSSATSEGPSTDDFRSRFPATYRAADGHMVRSRAEVLIDNYLYFNKIVHAYERKLPIEEDAYCDFYLPDKKVYIEYWGMEENARYAARKIEKQAIYQKHGFQLIELGDGDIELLDDVLPRQLIRFGIECA